MPADVDSIETKYGMFAREFVDKLGALSKLTGLDRHALTLALLVPVLDAELSRLTSRAKRTTQSVAPVAK